MAGAMHDLSALRKRSRYQRRSHAEFILRFRKNNLNLFVLRQHSFALAEINSTYNFATLATIRPR
jgi:hypothetical protein